MDEIRDFPSSSTKTYYNNHTIYAYNNSYVGNVSHNISLEPNKLDRVITMDEGIFPGLPTNLFSCGVLNTEDYNYRLNHSLTSEGTCFTIAAEGMTIDLMGRNITEITDNPWNASGTDNSGSIGFNVGNYDDITIENGVINDFGKAISSEGDNGEFNNLTITANVDYGLDGYLYGIYLSGENNNLTDISVDNLNNSGSTGTYGIYLSYSDNNRLTNINASSMLGGIEAEGIYLYGSSNNNLTNVVAQNTGFADLRIIFNSLNNLITDSQIGDISTASSAAEPVTMILLNTTYDYAGLYSHGELTRKWYYRAHTTILNPILFSVTIQFIIVLLLTL